MKSREFLSSSDELAEIRLGPKKERKDKVIAFKSELLERKKGLAVIQKELFNAIHQNPDSSKEELFSLVQEISRDRNINLPESWNKMISGVIDKYKDNRVIIKNLREKYPDDGDLFEAVFKFKPKSRVEVNEGPFALDFKIFNKDDFISAYYWNSLSKGLSEEQKANKDVFMGALMVKLPDPSLSGLVVIENFDLNGEDNARKVFLHEEQHAFNTLIELGNDQVYFVEIGEMVSNSQKSEREIDINIKIYLRKILKEQLDDWLGDRIMNELSAQFKGGLDSKAVFNTLKKTRDDGGSYDYFYEFREAFISSSNGIIDSILRKVILRNVYKVFIDEYRKLIREAVDAVRELTDGFNYSIDQALAFLMQEDIRDWKKSVGGLKKHQTSRAYKEYKKEFDKYGDKLEEISRKRQD